MLPWCVLPALAVILCANVPGLLKGPTGFLEESDKLARKAVFVIEGADQNADKFYYRELYPLLFGKEYPSKRNFIPTDRTLLSLGISAAVEIIEYNFDQPFESLDEALAFWKAYLPLETDRFDEILKGFLEKKLEKTGNGLIARFHKKSAVTWWRKQDSYS